VPVRVRLPAPYSPTREKLRFRFNCCA